MFEAELNPPPPPPPPSLAHLSYILKVSFLRSAQFALFQILVFVNKKKRLLFSLQSLGIIFYVILQREEIIAVYCFSILTLSRCTDHKQKFSVYFYTLLLVLLHLRLSLFYSAFLRMFRHVPDRNRYWNRQQKKKRGHEAFKSSKRVKTTRLTCSINKHKFHELDWVGSAEEHAAWCHCFHNLNRFLWAL